MLYNFHRPTVTAHQQIDTWQVKTVQLRNAPQLLSVGEIKLCLLDGMLIHFRREVIGGGKTPSSARAICPQLMPSNRLNTFIILYFIIFEKSHHFLRALKCLVGLAS